METQNFITKDGVKINIALDNQQLMLLAVGGFLVVFASVFLALSLSNSINGK